ncbi:ARGI1-like protein [Mya arenaria]|uniref:Arginase n=1 Tax=Mya arenaria TaxID=6604 RepID=A0ABY7FA42_MYAAR|nr:arginase-1-like [Mya arenaria]WAR19038.1 ARGI1-like protein [Mya arenaria]
MDKSSTSAIGTCRKLGVVGIPISKGQRRNGTEKGPQTLRDGGLLERLRKFGCEITDHGDVTLDCIDDDIPYGNVKNPRNIAMGSLRAADVVEKCLRTEGRCLAIGGDHSMAIGTIMGHARVQPDMVVLWIDAHADINTPLTSDSGNMHGMPLAFVAEELAPFVPPLPGWEGIQPCIKVEQIAWIGLRDVDPGERKIIEKFGMSAFSMHDVDNNGIKGILKKALDAVDPSGTKPIHVSFDVDAMDPTHTPSTGTPVGGGLSVREMCFIAEELALTGRLTMLDIAEVNPNIGDPKDVSHTVSSTIDVATHFFGHRRQGFVPAN